MKALRRITARTYLITLLGIAVLAFLGWTWLYIPDSHIWQFFFTIFFGAVIAAVSLALIVTIIRRLYPAPQRALWQSAVVLLAWLALGYVLQLLTNRLSTKTEMRAGYWNSRLSAHHRAFFTYQRLIDWQTFVLEVIVWIVIPAIILPFAVETIQRTERPWRTALATLRRWQLWLTVAVVYIAGSWLWDRILAWHPAYSVTGELISVTLRTALAYALVIYALLFALSVAAELLSREHARRDTVSQPPTH